MANRSELDARTLPARARTSPRACPFCLHELGQFNRTITPDVCAWHRAEMGGETCAGLSLGALLIEALDAVRDGRASS